MCQNKVQNLSRKLLIFRKFSVNTFLYRIMRGILCKIIIQSIKKYGEFLYYREKMIFFKLILPLYLLSNHTTFV